MNALKTRLARQQARVAEAARAAAVPLPTLIAVSKKHPAERIRELAALGQRDFGESYLDEALEKQRLLGDLPLVWHFIGPIQSNKTRGIAENFDWVHSLDRVRIADRLHAQRPESRGPLNVFLQVNVDAEQSKSGVMPEALPALLEHVCGLDRLRVVGLMAIPRPGRAPMQMQESFECLRALRDRHGFGDGSLPYLSIGMSDDLELAIAAGATHVRIGTALFGERE